MSQLILPRRSFLTGLVSLIAAPAVVKASNLMQVANIDHILYPVRGLINYDICTDNLIIRIDRANIPLIIPKNVYHVLNDIEIKALFTSEQIASIIPTTKQEKQQKYMWKEFNTEEWSKKGLLPLKF